MTVSQFRALAETLIAAGGMLKSGDRVAQRKGCQDASAALRTLMTELQLHVAQSPEQLH